MKTLYILIYSTLSISLGLAQSISGKQLLEKSIAFHDPNNQWATFSSEFKVVMNTPNRSPRISAIKINSPYEFFTITEFKDSISKTFTLDKTTCKLFYKDSLLDSVSASKHKMSCKQAAFLKNYYTYLYGLPMKLNDPGTNISDQVEEKKFKGIDYLVLKVSYDLNVGSDIWYFYFNPKIYALEVYQFFKTDTNGVLKLNSGEYILLKDLMTINGIKMPKIRSWYYNKNNTYLGTDTLKK